MVRFPAVQCKKVTAAFDGGRIFTDGGVLLLATAERRLGVAEWLARCFPDRSDPARITHTFADMTPSLTASSIMPIGSSSPATTSASAARCPQKLNALDRVHDAEHHSNRSARARRRWLTSNRNARRLRIGTGGPLHI
jgi:hypothetical protein